MISMESCDSCHPDVQCFYTLLRMSARMTGIMVRITQNKSFLCEERRFAGLAVGNHFNQGVLVNKKAQLKYRPILYT